MSGVGLQEWAERLAVASSSFGTEVRADGLELLGERRALDGERQPATRVLRCADAWVAVTLARDWDRDAVPAWLGVDPSWESVATAVAVRRSEDLVAGAELLGLAIGVLGERSGGAVDVARFGAGSRGGRRSSARSLRVLDLSALWAGPLCAALLRDGGADVVKVESTGRPDASRVGNPALFDRLNAGKRSVALDLASDEGRARLGSLVLAADVLVESSRPRALEQMGLVAADLVGREQDGPDVWVSVTGHGRASNRAGFGDDAAFAGGLARWNDGTPALWGDAAADPISGLVAATAAAEAVAAGERAMIDVALAGAAAEVALTLPDEPPEPRPDAMGRPSGEARPLGADTEGVLQEWAGR